ncbi:MAG: pyrroline-5-carboxylate reductase [Clostridia bacterium]
MFRLGILGVGNMGEAILRGTLKGHAADAKSITIFDPNVQKTVALQQELNICVAESIPQLLENSDVLLLAVKPNICASVFLEYQSYFSEKAILSIIAGWSRNRLAMHLPTNTRIMHIMPNTPAMVGEGMIVFEQGDTLTDDERAYAKTLFSAIGKIITVDAKLMNAVTGVSGSGPAYVYILIEAMGDAGVRAGLARSIAYELAAQTVLGSAKMVLETGIHPGELKDRVCSPGGTTIDAVAALEKFGFRNAVLEAISICCDKSEHMSK